MSEILRKNVAATAATVDSWSGKIRTIETQIAAAHAVIATSEAERKKCALQASLGEQKALTEIGKARAQQATAENDIKDLGHALAEARAMLLEAEGEATKARQNMTKFKVQNLQRKRVEAAAKIDAVISEFTLAFNEFEKLGQEIVSLPDQLQPNIHGMIDHQGPAGMRRVAAALPPVFLKFYPGAQRDEQTKRMPLAKAEEIYWGLAPIDSETKAA
jgi:chromosome segregation ATPase